MANFHIFAENSAFASGQGSIAFKGDSAGADTLTVDAGAFLLAQGTETIGALLANTRAWKVNVDGAVIAEDNSGNETSVGISLSVRNAATSSITIGDDGQVGGSRYGIFAASSVDLSNDGMIMGTGSGGIGVFLTGDNNVKHTISNTGTITGPNAIYSIAGTDIVGNKGHLDGYVFLGSGNDQLTNTGTITGPVEMETGADVVVNRGFIGGYVSLGDDADTFTNFREVKGVQVNGTVTGLIDLGNGDDRFLGGSRAETVRDNGGADFVFLARGNDVFRAAYAGGNDGVDTIRGGDGVDTYDAGGTTVGVHINLDNVAHDFGVISPGNERVGANTATGLHVAGSMKDTVINFENAVGGFAPDVIYGSGNSNFLNGAGGNDFLFGFGSGDRLEGGAGLDNLIGGSGRDLLTGGADADSFTFTVLTDSGNTVSTRDLITDFEDFRDQIALDAIDANTGTAANDAFTFIGTNVAFGGQTGELRAIWALGGQVIEGDVNGDKRADFSVEIKDDAHSIVLTNLDFIL